MRIVLGFLVAVALAGPCWAESVKVTLPAPLTLAPLPADARPAAVTLTRIAANLAPGVAWLETTSSPYFMVPCVWTGQVTRWRESDNKIAAIETFDRMFRAELKAAGFRSGGDPTNLFEDQSSSDLQVGALITDLKVRACDYVTLVGVTPQGAATMDVEWQIYSVSQGKILARVTTHGGGELKSKKDAVASVVEVAFADNVRRLVGSEEFRGIVLAKTGVQPAAKPVTAISFKPSAMKAVPLTTAVKSVVTIYAGESMGSGVVISRDGYILTNHHVAGPGGQVRVRWADGTDSVGEVVRSDPRRDVALIMTTPKAAPLAIRPTPAQLGETVFAIGTPLRKEFANTLTRGVVSATRTIEGQAMIQSDVAIDRGNSGGPLLDEKGYVVALAVSGYELDGVSRDINFFIPIEEALKALALTPAS